MIHDIEHQQEFNNPPAPVVPLQRRPRAPNRGVTCVLVKNIPDTVYHFGFGRTGRDVTIECVLGGIHVDDVYLQPDLYYDIKDEHGAYQPALPLHPNEPYLLFQDFVGDIDANTAALTVRFNTLSGHHQRNRFRIRVSTRLLRNDMEVAFFYTNAIASILKPPLDLLRRIHNVKQLPRSY